MSEFEEQENKRLNTITSIESGLKKNIKQQKRTILQIIRNAATKKIILSLISTMLIFTNYDKAYSDTNKVKREVKHFNEWLTQHIDELKEGTISWEKAINKFEDAFIGLEKEVRNDLEEHKYEKAYYNLQFFYKLADALNNTEMKQRIAALLNLVDYELSHRIEHEGIYQANGKIYIVGTIQSSNYNLARRRAMSNSMIDILRETARMKRIHVRELQGIVQGIKIINIYYAEEKSAYKYIVSVDIVEDIDTTRDLLKKLPRVSI